MNCMIWLEQLWVMPRKLNTELKIHYVVAKFIIWFLSINEKQQCVIWTISFTRWLTTIQNSSLDHWWCWLFGYNADTRQQSLQWKSLQLPRLKNPRQIYKSNKLYACLIFWHSGCRSWRICFSWSYGEFRLLLWCSEIPEGRCVTKKTKPVEEKKLAVAPWQHACFSLPQNDSFWKKNRTW